MQFVIVICSHKKHQAYGNLNSSWQLSFQSTKCECYIEQEDRSPPMSRQIGVSLNEVLCNKNKIKERRHKGKEKEGNRRKTSRLYM